MSIALYLGACPGCNLMLPTSADCKAWKETFLQTRCEPWLIPNGAMMMHGSSALQERIESQVSKKKAVGANPCFWCGEQRGGSTGAVPGPARALNAGGGFPC